MSALLITLLLVMAGFCHFAEMLSKKWYEDRMLLRMQGVFVGAAVVLIFFA